MRAMAVHIKKGRKLKPAAGAKAKSDWARTMGRRQLRNIQGPLYTARWSVSFTRSTALAVG